MTGLYIGVYFENTRVSNEKLRYKSHEKWVLSKTYLGNVNANETSGNSERF